MYLVMYGFEHIMHFYSLEDSVFVFEPTSLLPGDQHAFAVKTHHDNNPNKYQLVHIHNRITDYDSALPCY